MAVSTAFLAALVPQSAGADLFGRALSLSFGPGVGTISLPTRAFPNAGFVREREAIPVGKGPGTAVRQAVVHAETAPATDIGGGIAVPVRSMFQTDTVTLRLTWGLSWALRDARGVACLGYRRALTRMRRELRDMIRAELADIEGRGRRHRAHVGERQGCRQATAERDPEVPLH